jgi:alkylhydroperoxidase family enzyme
MRLGDTPDGVRSRRPPIAEAFADTRRDVLEGGLVDRDLKELCGRFLAGEEVEPRDERERAALDWAHAVAWDADRADDELWERLHAHFSEPELVELGYAIAFTLGQQHWLRTLGHSALSK